MTIALKRVDLHVLNMRTRMPFRYGIASMTALPHLFVRVQAEVDGRARTGLASEGLPPKWFTKDPSTTYRQDLEDMLAVIRHAAGSATMLPAAATPFEWWWSLAETQAAWGAAEGHPPLLSGLGTSLLERAMLDAYCRATGMPFPEAVRTNALGVNLGMLHAELERVEPGYFLPSHPSRRIVVRHTVGLADPLTDGDIPAAERLDDGLPQSLEAGIAAYGLTHFKIKLSGDLPHDIARLRQLSAVLGSAGRYAFTLDGNEHYQSIGAFADAWRALNAGQSLRELMEHLLFVEQPLHRDVALGAGAATELRAWRDRPLIIIDESDADPDSLPRALAAGYAGTSHKNCKGVFHGIGSACLIARRTQQQTARRFVISGEDLANVGPVALLQDLAVMATLGIPHVERNGHHYFRGLSMLPPDVQQRVLDRHGGLYHAHPDGFPTLAVRAGRIQVESTLDAPFGTRFLMDSTPLTPLDAWDFTTLGVEE